MAATESNRRSASLKIPALPFRGVAQKYPHSNVFTTMNNYLVITPELQRQMTEHVPMR